VRVQLGTLMETGKGLESLKREGAGKVPNKLSIETHRRYSSARGRSFVRRTEEMDSKAKRKGASGNNERVEEKNEL